MENAAYTSIELPTSVPGVGYTLKHRNCVEALIRYYCKRAVGKSASWGTFTQQDYAIMINRAKCHDMDKLLTSLCYPQLTADYFHRMFNGHHEESMIEPQSKSKYDWLEMLFDMESAHYTKADKQGGNAYTFASTYRLYLMPYLGELFEFFGLVEVTTIEEIKQQVNRKYYETDLVDAIINYIHTTHLHLLDGVSRIDDRGYVAAFHSAPPFRHPSTQHEGGTNHTRPNAVAQMSRSVLSREMVHGNFEAQLFDMDKICMIPAGQVRDVNNQALRCLKQMGTMKVQR